MSRLSDLIKDPSKQVLASQYVTLGDLLDLRVETLLSIKQMLDANSKLTIKKWLKSYEAEKLLGVSSNTLLNWRNNGIIPYSILGGIYYYDPEDIEKLLLKNKRNK